MSWMNSIVSWLKSNEDYFYDAYSEVYGWVYPFWLLAYPLLYASRGFGWLAYYFSLFNNWLVWAAGEISDILSWASIKSLIRSWLPRLEDTVSWFLDWWNKVQSVVTSWWSATQTTVKGWISTAVQPFNAMLTAWTSFWNSTWPGWVTSFNSLKSSWDNFWAVTFPTMVSFTWLATWWNSRLLDIQGLIDSAFTVRTSLWAGWQDWRDRVAAFFTDPEDWLYKSVDRIIERFW